LLCSCATREGEVYTHYFYKSESCTIGYTHTYGERIKGRNECFKNFRLEVSDGWIEGDNFEGAIVYRVKIDSDFLEVK